MSVWNAKRISHEFDEAPLGFYCPYCSTAHNGRMMTEYANPIVNAAVKLGNE
ncbi:hypothetical protein [Lactococcus lactis]|uniref:hypothetical protein n=1 Tax=Lactococcus lactis TaxID=1358 RepID=UPI003D2F4338